MTYFPREKDEPLALHLHRNAEAYGADRRQREALMLAAAMSHPARPVEDRREAGRVAEAIREELKAGLQAAIYEAQARGERVEAFNDEGAVRVKGRDGLVSLHKAGGLTDRQLATGLAYRALFEKAQLTSIGSQLGRGEGGAARVSTDAQVRSGLRAAYAQVQVTEAEKAVGCGQAIAVLRAVAGEGRTIRSLSSSGHRKAANAKALARALDQARPALGKGLAGALDAVATSLARTGGLRITGH